MTTAHCPHLELLRAPGDAPQLLLQGGGAPADRLQHPVQRAVLGVGLVVHRLVLRPLLRRYYGAEVAARKGSVVVVVVEGEGRGRGWICVEKA